MAGTKKDKQKNKRKRAAAEAANAVDADAATAVDAKEKCCGVKISEISTQYDVKHNRVHYYFKFDGKCGCNKYKISAASSLNALRNSEEDPAKVMMQNALRAIKAHQDSSSEACGLDLTDLAFFLRDPSGWRGLWGNIEDEIKIADDVKRLRSERQVKQYKNKAAATAVKDWEDGSDFKNANTKSKAVVHMMGELEQQTGKSIVRAKGVVSSMVSKLTKAIPGFKESDVLSEEKRKRIKTADAMMDSARACIDGMRNSINSKPHLLTGIAAMFLPQNPQKYSTSNNACCSLLGLNPKSKYVRTGLQNRAAFDQYAALDGEIKEGETVVCRDGYGELIELRDDCIKIKLKPWDTEVMYESAAKARIRRWVPPLDMYERKERSDKTPIDVINAIDSFHRKHNCTSPNKRDIATERHPEYRRQTRSAPRIYRYETWNELWKAFQSEYPGIAQRIQNPKQPHECPMLLRTHAPWEMIKGTDSSCLCINCEGTNAAKRGACHAIKVIDKVKSNKQDDEDGSSDDDDDEEEEEEGAMEDSNDHDNNVVNTTAAEQNEDDSSDDGEEEEEGMEDSSSYNNNDINTAAAGQEKDDSSDVDNDDDDAMDDITDHDINTAADERARAKLQKIYDILDQPYKYDMCMLCLPCIPEGGKLEDAKFSCIEGTCPKCGFDKLWSKGVRKRIFNREYDVAKREWVDKLNPDAALATEDWMEQIEWRVYVYKEKPTIAAHAKEMYRQAAAARPPEADDLDYSPSEGSTARNLVLETRRGTLVDYLDHIEEQMANHILHRNLVCTEHRSKLQYERNSRPLCVEEDIDFSENGSIENFDKVQSEHWITKQYTLFMAILSFLQVDDWNKRDGPLSEGDEVTVNGEMAGDKINMNSYWAAVIRDFGNETVEVKDADGIISTQPRALLRLRKRHTVCVGHISDDKKHDRFAMQKFTTTHLDYLEAYMKKEFPNDIPKGYITHLHRHSDNASQHFKSTGAIEYFTSLIANRGGAEKCSFVYSFGAPGHGKGCFDGIGGTFKNKIHQLIKSTKTSTGGVPGVDSGYIGSVSDVYDALKHYFESDEGKARSRKGKNPIDTYKFFCHQISDDPIRRPDEEFEKLVDITKNYQFAVTNVGIVHARNRSCWCLHCMEAMMAGSLGWAESKRTIGCTSSNGSTNVYQFNKRVCTKTRGVNVTRRREITKQNRNEMASKLTHGDWMLFESPEPETQPVWLGKAVGKEEWGSSCIWKNEGRRVERITGGVELHPGEYAINVQWYTHKEIGSLEYHIERDHPLPIVNSNKYLVHAGFEMTRVVGASTRVPRRRNVRSNQSNDFEYEARPSLQTTEGNWYRKEYGSLWALNQQDKDEALAQIGL